MTVRPLALYPAPLLRRPALTADAFGSELEALVSDVRDTLISVGAIGLTAPHICVLRRVMVVRLPASDALRIYVNPVVLWASDDKATHEEGSVSMPGIREMILRPARVRIGFQDLAGTRATEDASGFDAAVLQHEIDQLDGIFWIDRLSRLKRDRLAARFAKEQRRDQQVQGTG